MATANIDIPSLISQTQVFTEIQFQGDDPTWYLCGTGFDTMNLSPGAQSLTRRFVNQASDSTFTTGYATVIDWSLDEMIRPEITKLLNIARRRKIGAETIIRVRHVYAQLQFEHDDTGYIVDDQYAAFEQWSNVIVANESVRDNMLSASGQFTFVSDFQWGGYDPLLGEFTIEADMPAGTPPPPVNP